MSFSYVPYIVASIIYTHNNVHSLDAIAICRSLTYLKYAVNAFIFTRLDGRFLTVFFNILRCNSANRSNKICAKPSAPRVLDNMHQVEGDPQGEKVNDELPFNSKASSGNLTCATASRRQILSVSEGNRNRQRTQLTITALPLPIITITSPNGKTSILKGKKGKTSGVPKGKKSFPRNNYKTSVPERPKTV